MSGVTAIAGQEYAYSCMTAITSGCAASHILSRSSDCITCADVFSEPRNDTSTSSARDLRHDHVRVEREKRTAAARSWSASESLIRTRRFPSRSEQSMRPSRARDIPR